LPHSLIFSKASAIAALVINVTTWSSDNLQWHQLAEAEKNAVLSRPVLALVVFLVSFDMLTNNMIYTLQASCIIIGIHLV